MTSTESFDETDKTNEPAEKTGGLRQALREWLESALFAGVVIAVLFVVFWPFVISGNSMEPGFHDRDRIAISRAAVWLGRFERGDLVVCKMERFGKREHVIKRVIGVPGDRIMVTDGGVSVNGETLTEGYLAQPRTGGEVDMTLAADEYFVLGDNRDVSFDSRYSGAVKARDMVGRVIVRWFPFDKMTGYLD